MPVSAQRRNAVRLIFEAKKPMVFSEGLVLCAGSAYLAVLCGAGLLTNFVPTGPINTGTVLLYSLASLLSLIGILWLLNPLPKQVFHTIVAVFALSALTIIKSFWDTNPINQRARELAIYFMGALPFLFFIQVNMPKVRLKLFRVLAIGLFGLSVFAIFQGIFANYLPLSLFTLRGDSVFGVGEDQLRPTGLTGNPIIFSSIAVFASAFFGALWLETRKLRFLLALFCSLTANYLTYTRTSIVLVVPVLALVWLFHTRFRIKHKVALLVAVIILFAVGRYLVVSGTDLIIIQRLQNTSPESAESTLVHFQQIKNASDAIASHPFVGTGMGSQGDFIDPENLIITDGAWWVLCLEFGVPLAILMVALLIHTLIPLAKFVLRTESRNRSVIIATLSFHAYVFAANFINSSLLGHIPFGLYWATMGLSLAHVNYRHDLATTSLVGRRREDKHQ